jgi:hypothetical protein
LPIVNALARQRHQAARDAHIHQDDERSLNGIHYYEFRIFGNRPQEHAYKAAEQIASHGGSLPGQKLADRLYLGSQDSFPQLRSASGSVAGCVTLSLST